MSQDKIMVYAVVFVLVVWNLAVFITYGIDKRRAKKDKWRIPESALMCMALFMGAPGALLGMRHYHHKTKHAKFTIGVPLCLVFNIAVLVMLTKGM